MIQGSGFGVKGSLWSNVKGAKNVGPFAERLYHVAGRNQTAHSLSPRYEALKSVNKELIVLYGDTGSMIVNWQAGDMWGKSVVKSLAADLQKVFSGMSGLSVSNLWCTRLFYEAYSGKEKIAPLVRAISVARD